MSNEPGLVLLAFGGHARSVADVALAAGYRQLLFVDERAGAGETFLGFPVQKSMPFPAGEWKYVSCAGDNRIRLAHLSTLAAAGVTLTTIISPSATIAPGAVIEPGCFIGHHAHVGPLSRIGAGCIVNTAAVVEHDCFVGQGCHVSIHAGVAGYCNLGDRVFLGAGSAVIDRISIVSDVTIGAGGVVVTSIGEPGVYVGVPARRLFE